MRDHSFLFLTKFILIFIQNTLHINFSSPVLKRNILIKSPPVLSGAGGQEDNEKVCLTLSLAEC